MTPCIYINDFPVVYYNENGERKNVYGFLMQFSGYQGIWCVFATGLFIIWQIVSTSSVGHLQTFVHIKKSELGVTGSFDAHSSVTQTGMLHIKNKHLSLMFLNVPTSKSHQQGGIYSTKAHKYSRFCQRCFASLTEPACMPYYNRP